MLRVPSPESRVPALALILSFAIFDDFQATREAFVERINEARMGAGVHVLKLSAPLTSLAQARAKEIAAGGRGPEAASEEDSRRLAKAGYEARIVSEVEAQADGSVDEVVAAWREEKGGTARELVAPDYREVGVGVASKDDVPLYVLLFALSWEDFFRERTAALSDVERVRREMLARVNRERTRRGLAPLRRQPLLDRAAQAHADDMFARRYYSHDTPESKTTMDRVQALGYRARYAGENIARGQYSVDEVMDGWMESKTHRDHLLSPVFDDVGFGLAFGKNPGGYEILWVQNFARPKGRERL